jgi:hypothetical protein
MPKVFAGDSNQPLEAREWNGFIEAAEAYQRQALERAQRQPETSERKTNRVRIKAHTDLNRWDAIHVAGPMFPPTTDDRIEFEKQLGFASANPTGFNPFAIIESPVASGSIAWAIVEGYCIAKVRPTTGFNIRVGQHVHAQTNERFLRHCPGGFARVAWIGSDTIDDDLRWCVVHLGQQQPIRFASSGAGFAANTNVELTDAGDPSARLLVRSTSPVAASLTLMLIPDRFNWRIVRLCN